MKRLSVSTLLSTVILAQPVYSDPMPKPPLFDITSPADSTENTPVNPQAKNGVTENRKFIITNHETSQGNTGVISEIRATTTNNANSIKANEAKTANNTNAIQSNTSASIQNSFNIDMNTGSIGKNITDIGINKTEIDKNTTSTTTSATSIETNKAAIAENKIGIGKNQVEITENKTQVENKLSENLNFMGMQQTFMNAKYPYLDNISYSDGQLTLKPSYKEGNYQYTSDGKTYTVQAKDKVIQLFDSTASAQSFSELNMEMQHTRAVTDALSRNMTAQQQQLQDVQRQQDKHAKAISVNAAFAALPSGYMPDKNFVGIGVGHFDNRTGIAVGVTRSFENGVVVQGRYGVSGGTSVGAVAAGFSF